MWVLGQNPQILLHQQQQVTMLGKRGGIQVSRRDLRARALWSNSNLSRASMSGMEAINDSEQLDRILVLAQDHSQPLLIDWSAFAFPLLNALYKWILSYLALGSRMASWCRKCIYLKPKLEKLADEYETKVKFYYVDVNKVPQTLVKRGNISKMPTIQLWKDGEMKAEVIGGHKAWLVIEEVREMINKFI